VSKAYKSVIIYNVLTFFPVGFPALFSSPYFKPPKTLSMAADPNAYGPEKITVKFIFLR